MTEEVKYYLQQNFDLPATIITDIEIENILAEKINELIQNNFNHFIYLLYRVDIDEKRLSKLLKENPAEDAGKLIAPIIIERQLQKIKSRQGFKDNTAIDENEKW